MGVAVAVSTSLRDRPVSSRSFFVGEIGLGGEIRSVSRLPLRLKEAEKLGFAHAFVPARNVNGLETSTSMEVVSIETVSQLIDLVA